jgi:hypothetical protein
MIKLLADLAYWLSVVEDLDYSEDLREYAEQAVKEIREEIEKTQEL